MYCVGLIGNIASGKSTVAAFFKALAITVISADEVSRELTAAKQPALKLITAHFGKTILHPSGELNRPALREIIFADPQERRWLEQLLHPLIRKAVKEKALQSLSPYTLIEIPLLKKIADYPYLNRILVVLASNSEQQIQRIMQRDNSSREQAMVILATQSDHLSRLDLADDMIFNTSNLASLKKKVKNLHQYYLQLASQQS